MRKIYDSDIDRILDNVKYERKTGCFIWKLCKIKSGYGLITVNGKSVLAHRFSYEAFKGKIPSGMCVLHRCDNPSCVNDFHLFLGTHKDNTQDCINKGRHWFQRNNSINT